MALLLRASNLKGNKLGEADIFHGSADGLFITDDKGIIRKVNRAGASFYGLTPKDLTGMDVKDLESQNVFRPSATSIVLQEKRTVTITQSLTMGQKTIVTAAPVFDDGGRILKVIGNIRDATLLQILESGMVSNCQPKKYSVNNMYVKKENDVTENHQMHQKLKMLSTVDTPILFLGESGVGKDYFAKILHSMSTRNQGPFININCGAIPENLMESEIFGYEPGAFTGAGRKGKMGLIEAAHGGTLFLNEIGELSLNLQVKLLQVLEEKKFTRIGGVKPVEVNFRLISATNRDLEELVRSNLFRKDLFYRLSVVSIRIPPLRERKQDIIALARHFLQKFNEQYNLKKKFSNEVLTCILNYSWPGNIRQLQNVIENLVVTSSNDTLHPSSLPLEVHCVNKIIDQQSFSLADAVAEAELKAIQHAKAACRTTYEIARFLKVSQATVVRKLQKYGLD